MKLKKLMEKADIWFDPNQRDNTKRKKCVKKVLKKLRKYEKYLNEQLLHETDPDTIERINKKLALTHAQREKGLKILDDIMSEKEQQEANKEI